MKISIDDHVKLINGIRINGKVKYITCYNSTIDNGLCSAKLCKCSKQEFVWVNWPDGSISSYHKDELLDENMENFKKTVLEFKENQSFDWDKYNGLKEKKVRVSVEEKSFEPDDIDWDEYYGHTK